MTGMHEWRTLAESQLGLIARRQALKCGVSRHRIDDLVKRDQLIRFRHGVLKLSGAPITWKTKVMAACLQAMPGSAACSSTAAVLLGLEGVKPREIEIATTRSIKAKGDVLFHRVSRLPAEQITSTGPIPVTVVERTILDLAGHGRRWEVDSAIDSALRKRVTSLAALKRFLADEARSGTHGVLLMRQRLSVRDPDEGLPRSPLEREVLESLRRWGFPQPQVNVPIRGEDGFFALVDFLFSEQKVVIEVQSYAHHSALTAFNRDAERLSELTARGYRPIEVTLEQIRDRPFALIRRLEQMGVNRSVAAG